MFVSGEAHYRKPNNETPEKSPELRRAQLKRLINEWKAYRSNAFYMAFTSEEKAQRHILICDHVIRPLEAELSNLEKSHREFDMLRGQQSNTGLDTFTKSKDK